MIRARAAMLAAVALAPAAAIAQSALKGHNTDAPVNVTSDRIEVEDRVNRATFIGTVHAVQGDMTMDAQRMTVAYRKGAGANADPEIQRIDASGGVTVVDPSERAKGNFGIYDLDRRLITLIGNVALTRGTNTVNGARLVIDLNTGRSTVDGNTVGAPGGSAPAGSGRVTGRFTVPKRNTPTAASPTTPAAASPAPGTTPPPK